ncbi:MAG: alpha/beta fold hydrolase [Acidobacteriota bacterium]|nr:alpha/beta fold hydrolase [Acidobacteriota bacterium]
MFKSADFPRSAKSTHSKRLVKSFYRLTFPIILLLALAIVGASVWLYHTVSIPPRAEYLVIPENYGQFSTRGARVTNETWANPDGTTARGWLLKGAESLPAVILLHAYGADRSHVLDLAVKLNEATNFTVLMPDERGHGVNPALESSSFGGCETDDAAAAIEFLRGLKTENQTSLIGKSIGFYGVEMGALAALNAAAADGDVKALALDSVPDDSDAVLATAVNRRFPFASFLTAKFASFGSRFYFYNGCYRRDEACDLAKSLTNRQVLLLAGADATYFQDSTVRLSRCFSNSVKVEAKTDLSPSGYNLMNASLEQSTAYDERVIEFFKNALISEK